MDKWYLTLSAVLLSSTSVSSIWDVTSHPVVTNFQQKSKDSELVIKALQQFVDSKKPLELDYLGPDHEIEFASSKWVSKYIRRVLHELNPTVFTKERTQHLLFEDVYLWPGEAVRVHVHYQGTTDGIYIYIREGDSSIDIQIETWMEMFSLKTNALDISYLGPAYETKFADDPVVSQHLKARLKKLDAVFTPARLKRFSFSHVQMQVDRSIKIKWAYIATPLHPEHQHSGWIWVKEGLSPLKETATEIAHKIRWTFYLKNFCEKKYLDDPAVLNNIRETLVAYGILTKAEAEYIQPKAHELIVSNHQYRLWIAKDGKSALTQRIHIVVWQKSQILSLVADDLNCYFLAYFTPRAWRVLQKILLLKAPYDEWIGTLLQFMNDGDFNERTDVIPDFENVGWKSFLSSIGYYKAFPWDNRLENHMGSFGAWDDPYSSTAEYMARIRKCRGGCWTRRFYGADVLRGWIDNFIHRPEGMPQGGVMMRLKWTFRGGTIPTYRFKYQFGWSAIW